MPNETPNILNGKFVIVQIILGRIRNRIDKEIPILQINETVRFWGSDSIIILNDPATTSGIIKRPKISTCFSLVTLVIIAFAKKPLTGAS